MKLRDPSHEVTVLERNKADDTFGWGVVLSDDAWGNMEASRQHSRHSPQPRTGRHRRRPPSVCLSRAVRLRRHRRMKMLRCCGTLGWASICRFKPPAAEHRHDYDVVVACDGINSLVRTEFADVFRPDIDTRLCKFIWLGTHQKFDARSPSSSRASTAGCGSTPTSSTPIRRR